MHICVLIFPTFYLNYPILTQFVDPKVCVSFWLPGMKKNPILSKSPSQIIFDKNKRLRHGKKNNFIQQTNQGELPKLLPISKYTSSTHKLNIFSIDLNQKQLI